MNKNKRLDKIDQATGGSDPAMVEVIHVSMDKNDQVQSTTTLRPAEPGEDPKDITVKLNWNG